MPTYEYQCGTCKKHYDLQESFSAPSQHVCQKCGKGEAKRVLHAPRVVFKGKGWYATDSRSTSTHIDESPDDKAEKSEDAAKPKAKKSKDGAASGSSNAEAAKEPASS